MLFIKKKDGTFRLCVDYRQLNCKTRENSNFRKKGKTVISVKTQNFSRSWMTNELHRWNRLAKSN